MEAVRTYAALLVAGLIGSALVVAVGLLVGSLYVVREHGLAWAVEQGCAIVEGAFR